VRKKRRRKLPRDQEIAMFAKRRSEGLSSKDLDHGNSSIHTRPSNFQNQTSDPRIKHFINTGLGTKKIIKKSIISPKKQPEPKPAPQFTPKIISSPDFSKIINPLEKISEDKFAKIIAGTIATGLSVLTGTPIPLVVYKSLVTAKTLHDISKRMENINLKNELKEITKQNLEKTSQEILKQKTEQVSKKITDQSQELGLIRTISDLTTLSEKSTHTLFRNTINNTIDDGIGNLTNIAVTLAL